MVVVTVHWPAGAGTLTCGGTGLAQNTPLVDAPPIGTPKLVPTTTWPSGQMEAERPRSDDEKPCHVKPVAVKAREAPSGYTTWAEQHAGVAKFVPDPVYTTAPAKWLVFQLKEPPALNVPGVEEKGWFCV